MAAQASLSTLVANPEDRFSCDDAHMALEEAPNRGTFLVLLNSRAYLLKDHELHCAKATFLVTQLLFLVPGWHPTGSKPPDDDRIYF